HRDTAPTAGRGGRNRGEGGGGRGKTGEKSARPRRAPPPPHGGRRRDRQDDRGERGVSEPPRQAARPAVRVGWRTGRPADRERQAIRRTRRSEQACRRENREDRRLLRAARIVRQGLP